jgi:hypothetical protein
MTYAATTFLDGRDRQPQLIDCLYTYFCSTPSDIQRHLPALRRYAKECRTVTELGVRRGISTAALITGRPRSVVSYDLDGRHFRGQREHFYRQAAQEVGVAFEYIEADVLRVEIAPTELLFIDTWHVYEQLSAELALHAPRTERFILLHDTETFGEVGEDSFMVRAACLFNDAVGLFTGKKPIPKAARHRGLRPAIEEFLLEHDEWHIAEHFPFNNGLTVLARSA